MHIIPFEIPLPKNETDFERMCAQVYGVVFNDPMPKMNGRRGQAQGGVDVFVKEPKVGRVGIQCKKYAMKPLKWEDVEDEVAKADKHKTLIKKLVLATTAPNDAVLLGTVQQLSDDREAKGLFSVEVEFWEDICNHIDRYPVLQDSYAPHSPGAAYHRQEASFTAMLDIALDTNATVRSLAVLPPASSDSVDRIITGQLDHTNELLKAGRYRDALDHLAVIGKDLKPFDAHQKARWYLQKGLSIWYSRSDDLESAGLFLKAFETYPDDDRMVAAQIRGLMLQDKFDEASAVGESAQQRFPDSPHVWFALANIHLILGEPVPMKDLSEALQQDPDTLQFAAQAELKAGNLDEALRLSQDAAQHPGAGFFIRANALRIAAECGSRFPIAAMAGALPVRETKALEFAITQFYPLHERLWNIQSDSVSETVTHLGYALQMLHRFDEALALARDAEVHGYRSAEVLGTRVTALFELDREGELLVLASERLNEMSASSLSIVGQVATKEGNLALLKQISDAALACDPVDDEAIELLAALRWDALVRADQQEAAVREVLAAKVHDTGGLISACIAARVLHRSGRTLEAAAVVNRAKSLMAAGSTDRAKLMLAELLFYVEQFEEAGALYERLVTPGRLSDLHNKLLACYVRSHNRRKARELLGRLPAEWIGNDGTLSLAIELGHQAADWAFLRPLTKAQLRRHPNSAESWLFEVSVSLHSSAPAKFQNDLRNVPELLEGPYRSNYHLAGLELRYGEAERGMRRLYRTLRLNLDEPEALSMYFFAILGGPLDLPLMEDELPAVAPGSCVTVVDAFGQSTRLVIDPSDVGDLPKRAGYADRASPQAVALLGAVVGQQLELPALAFGDTQRYTVTAIQSAYRYMLQVVRDRADALGGLPHMKMVRIDTSDDGKHDLSHMEAEVIRSSDRTHQLFDGYSNRRMTLSGFAERRGVSAVDVVVGWPIDGPQLFVGTGTEDERVAALELLSRSDAVYVIDSLTITELVNLGVQEALAYLPKVLISTLSKSQLDGLLRESVDDRSVATSTEVGGELAIIEHDDRYHARRTEFFTSVLAAVEQYCVVQPAYGDLGHQGRIPSLIERLQDEELEVLLLAKEANATVLTLDGRLRAILKFGGDVDGIWPQALLMHCGSKNLVDPMKLAPATIRQFLLNRSFVSLSAGDLVWMVRQGGAYLQLGMRRYKVYLSSDDTEFGSSVGVAFEFLKRVASRQTQLGAFGELLEHVVEAAMRHVQCPPDFEVSVTEFFFDLMASFNGSNHPYGPVNDHPIKQIQFRRRHLAERISRARERANALPDNRPVAVRTLFCSRIPWLVADKSIPTAEPATEVQLQANTPESAQANAIDSSDALARSDKTAFLATTPKIQSR